MGSITAGQMRKDVQCAMAVRMEKESLDVWLMIILNKYYEHASFL